MVILFLGDFLNNIYLSTYISAYFYSKLYSRCIPRWSIMKGMKFVESGDRNKWLQRDSQDRSLYGTNGVRDSLIDQRYTDQGPPRWESVPKTHTATSIENCARWCLLSSSCDMFYYTHSGGGVFDCKMYQNDRKKFANLYEIIEPAEQTATPNLHNIYVLHCSPAMENWVINSDPYSHSLQRKLFLLLLNKQGACRMVLIWRIGV